MSRETDRALRGALNKFDSRIAQLEKASQWQPLQQVPPAAESTVVARFLARLTGSSGLAAPFTYTFEQAYQTAAGTGNYSAVSGGITGTAYNDYEECASSTLTACVTGAVVPMEARLLPTGAIEYRFCEECCCEEEPNPCDPDPEMLCTVTGAAGVINWLGQTWTLPADSGVEKSVCPTVYYKYKASTATVSPPRYDHYWKHYSPLHANRGRLTLQRYLFTWYGTTYNAWNLLRASDSTPTWFGMDFRSIWGSSVLTLGVLTSGSPMPTPSDWSITDNFFGSRTVGGITYAWRKGSGW